MTHFELWTLQLPSDGTRKVKGLRSLCDIKVKVLVEADGTFSGDEVAFFRSGMYDRSATMWILSVPRKPLWGHLVMQILIQDNTRWGKLEALYVVCAALFTEDA